MPNCVVCGLPGAVETPRHLRDTIEWNCAACGAFVLTNTAAAIMRVLLTENPGANILLSHLLRRSNPKATENIRPISSEDLRQMVEINKLPMPMEQCDYLISALGEKTLPGDNLMIETPEIRSLVGAASYLGLRTLVRHLFEERELEVSGNERAFDQQDMRAKLTVRGWARYRDMQTKGIETRNAFMAMEFNEPNVERAYREAFALAATDCGFVLAPLTERQGAGLIDDQLRVRIRNCAFVVADVTTGNLGAYWEAGFAEGLGKPVIYTCHADAFQRGISHFDTNHHLTVQWDLENLPTTREKLAATIRATLPDKAR